MVMQLLQRTQTIVRYQNGNGRIFYGILEDDEILQLTSNFTEIVDNQLKFDGVRVKYDDVKILEPVNPSKVVNFGWTYAAHAKETGGRLFFRQIT